MKHTLIAVGLLAGLVLTSSPAEAQTGGARGKVVDGEGKGIPEATVVFDSPEGGARFELRTNEKGEYIQVGLSPGAYRITVTKEGYQGLAVQARIGIGMATDIDRIELEEAAPTPAEQAGSVKQEVLDQFASGVELTQTGQLEEAAAVFEGILEAHPGILEVHRNLGFIYAQQKDWPNAERHFLAALELSPGDPDFVAALVKIYEQSGQEEKAKELVRQAASDNPADGMAQFNQGIFLLKEGKTEEAMGAFEAALAADPPAMEAHYYLGTLLVGQDKAPEAVEHLEAYVASNPENAQNLATAQGLLEALKQ